MGFIDDFWHDVLAVTGVAGFILTAIGLWFAWVQLRRTTTASRAATEAAIAALNESRLQYDRYVVSQAHRFLQEARHWVKNGRWEFAAIRLGDLAELLLQASDDDGVWKKFAERLHGMESSFERIHAEKISFTPGLEGKWQKLQRELRLTMVQVFGPFPMSREEIGDAH